MGILIMRTIYGFKRPSVIQDYPFNFLKLHG
jgi:hypothetical protein